MPRSLFAFRGKHSLYGLRHGLYVAHGNREEGQGGVVDHVYEPAVVLVQVGQIIHRRVHHIHEIDVVLIVIHPAVQVNGDEEERQQHQQRVAPVPQGEVHLIRHIQINGIYDDGGMIEEVLHGDDAVADG